MRLASETAQRGEADWAKSYGESAGLRVRGSVIPGTAALRDVRLAGVNLQNLHG